MSTQLSEKPKGENEKSGFTIIGKYLLAYILLSLFVLLAAVILFRVRMNIVQIAFLVGLNSVKVKGISNLGVLITGLLLLAGIVASEDYLRNGVELGKLCKRALRIFIIEAGILIFLLSLYYIIRMIAI